MHHLLLPHQLFLPPHHIIYLSLLSTSSTLTNQPTNPSFLHLLSHIILQFTANQGKARSNLNKGDTHSKSALVDGKVKETGVVINDGRVLEEEELAQHQVVLRIIPVVHLLPLRLHHIVLCLLQQESHSARQPPVVSAEEPLSHVGPCDPRVQQNLKSLMRVVLAGVGAAGVLVVAEANFGWVMVARAIVMAGGDVVVAWVVIAAPYKDVMGCVIQAVLHIHPFLKHVESHLEHHASQLHLHPRHLLHRHLLVVFPVRVGGIEGIGSAIEETQLLRRLAAQNGMGDVRVYVESDGNALYGCIQEMMRIKVQVLQEGQVRGCGRVWGGHQGKVELSVLGLWVK
ncbi:hypothetical protein Pcinc_037920 [Petrolisthes cinctipes]|uniref:Uncharacterized protein n=1 Tax=Petrolisthes cinctipes TaxID=88211 RepID=A0AAE1BS18_PETCI|nr:hypothetical protein Pcinc_037920 [Petrolisthes cinctipes]